MPEESTNIDRKGKGKAKQPNQPPSMASRVVTSAAGLARNIVSPPGQELVTGLASSFAISTKPSSSRTVPNQPSTSESSTLRGASFEEGSLPGLRNRQKNSSVPGQAKEKLASVEIDGFLARPQDGLGVILIDEHPSSRWAAEFLENSKVPANEPPADALSNSNHFHCSVAGGNGDGAEVTSLLLNPDFVAMTDVFDLDGWTSEFTTFQSDDVKSSENDAVVKWLKSTLPDPPVHQTMPADHPRNLLPNFDVDRNHTSPSQEITAAIPSLLPHQREQLVNEWSEVLNIYTDEVWGDCLPLVKEVKSQLEKAKADSFRLDSTALSRLKMILRHVSLSPSAQKIFPICQPIEGQMTLSKTIVFYCPWVRCHEKFYNSWDLHLHSSQHRRLACPQSACVLNFANRDDWTAHIRIAHHDLLDSGT